jgi:hypothetical protein
MKATNVFRDRSWLFFINLIRLDSGKKNLTEKYLAFAFYEYSNTFNHVGAKFNSQTAKEEI